MTQSFYHLEKMGIDVWKLRPSQSSEPVSEPIVNIEAVEQPVLDWTTLAEKVAACQACDLAKTRTQTVFGVGDQKADVLFVGEAPGAQEDKQGEPFVGRAGQLLDNMLKAIGVSREQVFIANVLKCRPPNNRDPSAEEMACCTPFLEQQIALLQPKVIVALGRIAAHYLLKTNQPLSRLRQKQWAFAETPMLVTYHPAYLLRSPTEKAKSYADLQHIRALMTQSTN